MKHISRQQLGKLGATVAGTESVFYWWPSQTFNRKKETPNEQVSVHH
jgi:hypothetical protein